MALPKILLTSRNPSWAVLTSNNKAGFWLENQDPRPQSEPFCLKPFTTLYFGNTYVQPKILWWPYLESCWPLEILPEWFWRPIMKKVFDWQTKIRGHKVNPKKGKHRGQWKPDTDSRPLVLNSEANYSTIGIHSSTCKMF